MVFPVTFHVFSYPLIILWRPVPTRVYTVDKAGLVVHEHVRHFPESCGDSDDLFLQLLG